MTYMITIKKSKRPRVKLIVPRYKEKKGAKLVDFEFGDWRDFFLLPEDKFESLKRLKGYNFVVEIDNSIYYNTKDDYRYIIPDIPDNIKTIKIFLPERPPKRTWYYLHRSTQIEDVMFFFNLEKFEMAEFGYHLTLRNTKY